MVPHLQASQDAHNVQEDILVVIVVSTNAADRVAMRKKLHEIGACIDGGQDGHHGEMRECLISFEHEYLIKAGRDEAIEVRSRKTVVAKSRVG